MPMHDFEGTLCFFSHYMIWQNDSLTAMRAFEVLMILKMIETELGFSPDLISLYAEAYPSLPAAVAALLYEKELRKIEYGAVPVDMEEMVFNRFYSCHDVMNSIIPGALVHFDYSDLFRWTKTIT
jgi:hypothetical protein